MPDLHRNVPNVEYVQANILEVVGQDERFQPGAFDFVTHRMLVLGIPNWKAYLTTCFDLLKPGGRIELQDISMRWYDIDGNRLPCDWAWVKLAEKSSAKFGIDLYGPDLFPQLLTEAGFVDVEIKPFAWTMMDECTIGGAEPTPISNGTLSHIFPIGDIPCS